MCLLNFAVAYIAAVREQVAWLVHGGIIVFGMTSSRCSTRVRCAQADDTELRKFEVSLKRECLLAKKAGVSF